MTSRRDFLKLAVLAPVIAKLRLEVLGEERGNSAEIDEFREVVVGIQDERPKTRKRSQANFVPFSPAFGEESWWPQELVVETGDGAHYLSNDGGKTWEKTRTKTGPFRLSEEDAVPLLSFVDDGTCFGGFTYGEECEGIDGK